MRCLLNVCLKHSERIDQGIKYVVDSLILKTENISSIDDKTGFEDVKVREPDAPWE